MPWPKPGANLYNSQLGLTDKGRAIKGLVVYSILDVSALLPSQEVSINL